MSTFASKIWEIFDKNSAYKIWSKKDKEIKVSPLMPIMVNFLKTDSVETAQLEIVPISDLADCKNFVFKLFATNNGEKIALNKFDFF